MNYDRNKKLHARLTISRVHCSNQEDFISIDVVDDISSCTIWSGEVSMDDFARLITGQGSILALHRFVPSAQTVDKYLKKRLTQVIYLKGINRYYNHNTDEINARKEEIRDAFIKQYLELVDDGWLIYDDGIGTKQEDRSGWRVTLVKFVDVNEIEGH